MDPTKPILTVKEFEGSTYTDWEITQKIQEQGWTLLAVRIAGGPASEGNQEIIYTLGHPSASP